MSKDASLSTRIAYCLVLLGAILPLGLAKFGWVALATGPSLAGSIPYVGPILFLIIGIYRAYVVARTPSALNAPQSSGFVSLLRSGGTFLLYVGAVSTVLGWLAGPLMHIFMQSRTESGAEFFFVGFIFALLGRVGVIGLLLFELARLRSFEQQNARGV
jgi:hypothetical protein